MTKVKISLKNNDKNLGAIVGIWVEQIVPHWLDERMVMGI